MASLSKTKKITALLLACCLFGLLLGCTESANGLLRLCLLLPGGLTGTCGLRSRALQKAAVLLQLARHGGDLFAGLRHTRHAASLITAGFREDVAFCVQQDVMDVIPIYRQGVITRVE